MRIDRPKTANPTITPNATTAACHASRLRSAGGRSRVSPMKTGTTPGGSVMTSRVTNASQKNLNGKNAAT
jgi:hypothetical protein